MKKLLVICGPTATGKTALGVKLAKKFNGEIVSADSRQVYKGMDIGTGKDLPLDVPIWGLDLVKPDEEFSVAHWVKFAQNVIQDIWKRKKFPIIVGGTGFWIKALIDGVDSIRIPVDWKLRKILSPGRLLPGRDPARLKAYRENYIKKLREMLKKLDPERMREMNKSDRENPRRLIRAIEITKKLEIENSMKIVNCKLKINQLLIIGLKARNKYLYQRIDQRVEKRVKQGAQKEVESLIKKGYSWDLSAMSATGYKEWQPFLQDKTSLNKVIQRWKYNEHAYARRQITWFKKNEEIKWFDIEKTDWQDNLVKLVKSWYDSSI